MLKFILAILIVANGGLFAYNTGVLGEDQDPSHEPARTKNQLNADRILLERLRL